MLNQKPDQRLVDGSKQRVLLLDASRAFSIGLSALLDSDIYEGKSFHSVADAIAALASYSPNFVICDLQLAATDDYVFFKNLRNGPLKQIPILVLSASEDSPTLLRAVDAGADALCAKENVRVNLLPQLRLLSRSHKNHAANVGEEQLKQVQTKIGAIKHDLGNAMAVLEGKFRTLLRTHPSIQEDPAVVSMKSALERVGKLHKELNELRQDKGEVELSKTIKAG